MDDAEEIRNVVLCAGEIGRSEDFDDQGWSKFISHMEPDLIRSRLQSNELLTFCYDCKGVIKGIITIKNYETVNQLFVLPEFHRQGVARKLWEFARDICIANGNIGRFQVRSSSLAVPVYESFGFVQTGSRDTQDGVSFTPMMLNL